LNGIRARLGALCAAFSLVDACSSGALNPKGPVAADEKVILFDATATMLTVVIPVIVCTLAFAWWFRARNPRAARRPDWQYSGRIEFVTWSIPAMIILFLGGVTWIGSHDLDPHKALRSVLRPVDIEVVSLDWKWLFIYPQERIATVNELVIPVDAPIRFTLTSGSVMNSFFVPQLGSQIYTMAGMATHLQLQADHVGTYRGLSAQYSGAGFADMRFTVEAVPAESFAQWVDATRSAGPLLDAQGYADLAKPSAAVAPFSYRAVSPDLFNGILRSAMQPDPRRLTHAASERTE
jgi:cytochrome o ubiquinol oxidase subunit 2